MGRFYHRKGNFYEMRGQEGLLFENEECLRYVIGEHGSEIAQYVRALIEEDYRLFLREEKGMTIVGLRPREDLLGGPHSEIEVELGLDAETEYEEESLP